MNKQDPPFAVQIEFVEGCTLSCDFCGINGIREKPGNFKNMSLETLQTIADDLLYAINNLGWNPRIEMAMHGEPSMHPQVEEAVAILRQTLGPKTSIVMFSNGTGFFKNTTINGILEAGLNTLGLDAYEHVNVVPRLMEAYDGKYPVYHYPQDPKQNMHSGRRVGHRDIVVIQDITTAETGNHATLNTHCGGGMEPPEELPIAHRCAKPFRELAIRWDGNIALCCNDFRGIYKIGDATVAPLYEIWDFIAFQAARKKLYHRDRAFTPCDKCNARSMRVGLLPDKKGLDDLPVADSADDAVIDGAIAGSAYTPIVLRQWEKP